MNPMLSNLRCAVVAVLLLVSPSLAWAEPPSAQTLIERQRQEKAQVWADGDIVTFFYRGEADQVDVMFGGDTRSLSKVADSDVWTLSVQLPDLDRAVFSYRFIAVAKGRQAEKQAESAVWRGRKAPPAAAECAKLKGTLKQFGIESRALGALRKVTVYLPPGHDPKKSCRVVYAADGQAIDRFARVLEPLVAAAQTPPIVIVGVHNGGYIGGPPDLKKYDPQKDLRLQEYFPGINPKRFSDHESFFCAEVPAWTERAFGASSVRADRVVFGYSNGGRFAVEMGLRHPDVFGNVFGFSVAGNGKFDFGANQKDLPHCYLTAGTWEKSFHSCTSSLADQLKARGASVRFSSRVGGHDTALWRDEFVAALLDAFGKK
jgi:enterochelin esterase-like enzyme